MQFFDDNGDPLNAGLVYTYEPGTTTAKTAYTDQALTVPHANPVVLSSAGRLASPIWCNGETKILVKTSAGVSLNPTIDNFNASTAGFGAWSTKNDDVVTKTANYSITAADDGKMIVATSNTWTLDNATVAESTLGNGFIVTFINLGSGVVTFDPQGTVNGASTIVFPPGTGAQLRCDGVNWRAVQSDNGMQLVQSGTVSGAPDLQITNLLAQYAAYLIVFNNLQSVDDNIVFQVTVSTDNGSTWKTGATDYAWARATDSETGIPADSGDDEDTRIILFTGCGNQPGETLSGKITVFNPMGADRTQFEWSISGQTQAPVFNVQSGGGQYQTAGATNALRLQFGSGNISTMTYAIYGLRL